MNSGWRRARATAALAVGLVATLHVALLASWRVQILPDLRRSPHQGRLFVPSLTELPAAPLHWPLFSLGLVQLRAPLGAQSRPVGDLCRQACRIALERGWLTHIGPRTESYDHTLRLYAPHANDVRLTRFPWNNWQSVIALSQRVSATTEPPQSFRFETPAGRGVVVRFVSEGVERYVVYAYPPFTDAGVAIAMSRVSPATLVRILASLDFEGGTRLGEDTGALSGAKGPPARRMPATRARGG